MKILIISQHFYPDMVSTGLHMTELSTKWIELFPNIDISVFTAENSRDNSEFIKYEIYKGVKVHRVKNIGKHHGTIIQRIKFSLGFIFFAFFFLIKNRKNFDLIFLTTNPPFLGILILLIKKVLSINYVVISYDIYPQILSKLKILKESNLLYIFWKWLNIKVYNNATKVISIGEDMTEIIIKEMKLKDKSKIELIHNWSDRNKVFPISKNENTFLLKNNYQNKKILLYSGTMGTTHNIEEILLAAEDLKNYSEILFLFIGGGSKEKLIKDHIIKFNSSNVVFMTFQPIETLSQTLSCATMSFVCLDSDFTGLSVPSKAYGIMAAKVPIICLMDNNSEIAKMVLDNQCGIVWNKDSNKKLSSIILDLVFDQSKLSIMGEKAMNTFINNFQIDISITKYNNLSNKILS